MKKPKWHPQFMPQATIQHPLKYTVPLYFSLFGYKTASSMISMVEAVPFLNMFYKAHEQGNSIELARTYDNLCSDLGGLLFLHALTIVRMTPIDEQTDGQQLSELITFQRLSQQVDSKLRLQLMSRRPFSMMWHELREDRGTPHINYSDIFVAAFTNNRNFGSFGNPFTFFRQSNYAEQFFSDQTGNPIDLVHLQDSFDDGFVGLHQEQLTELLRQGIISLTMLRHLKPDIDQSGFAELLQDGTRYFKSVLDSVDTPSVRYEIDTSSSPSLIIRSLYAHDALSPPWILDRDNSMGAFQAPLTSEESKFGNAVIEVRAIRYIKEWILKRMGIYNEHAKDCFLQDPGNIQIHALLFFDFLFQFGSPRDFEDFRTGFTHAIYKH